MLEALIWLLVGWVW